jgi:hypothetical protein
MKRKDVTPSTQIKSSNHASMAVPVSEVPVSCDDWCPSHIRAVRDYSSFDFLLVRKLICWGILVNRSRLSVLNLLLVCRTVGRLLVQRH